MIQNLNSPFRGHWHLLARFLISGIPSRRHDKRVRLAANYAINRQELTEAETLGASKPTGMVPRAFEFTLPFEPYPYDPAKAKQLLAEAGYPNGFDAGDLTVVPPILIWVRRS